MPESPSDVHRRLPRLGTHVPALDGVRGAAMLLVMLCHFTLYGGIEPVGALDRAFIRVALSGWIGVDLFFVLSGFLITGVLYNTKTGDDEDEGENKNVIKKLRAFFRRSRRHSVELFETIQNKFNSLFNKNKEEAVDTEETDADTSESGAEESDMTLEAQEV